MLGSERMEGKLTFITYMRISNTNVLYFLNGNSKTALEQRHSAVLVWVSVCGPPTSSVSITWGLAGNLNYQSLPETH